MCINIFVLEMNSVVGNNGDNMVSKQRHDLIASGLNACHLCVKGGFRNRCAPQEILLSDSLIGVEPPEIDSAVCQPANNRKTLRRKTPVEANRRRMRQ